MSKVSLSDNLIRGFFIAETEQIEVSDKSIKDIEDRLNFREHRKISVYAQKNIVLTVACCLVLMIGLSISLVSPVRAFAQDIYDRVKVMIYSITVGNDGGYRIIQIPKEDAVKDKTFRSVPNEITYLDEMELSKELGYQVKIPDFLECGYALMGKYLGQVYEAPAERIEDTSRKSLENTFNESKSKINTRKEVAAIYNKGSGSHLILLINDSEKADPFKDSKGLRTNIAEQKINGIPSTYFVIPTTVYPNRTDADGNPLPDNTKLPDKIGTLSVLTWCDHGTYYYLVDENEENKLSLSELSAVADSIIRR